MAKNESKKNDTQPVTDEPSDFQRIDLPDLDGYWVVKEGSIVTGRILGHFTIHDERKGDRDIILVRLEKPTLATLKTEEGEFSLEEGKVVGVGIRYKLLPLMNFVESKARIWVKARGKRSIGGGQTMWDFAIAVDPKTGKKTPPPLGSAAARGLTSTNDADTDIPF